MNTQLNIHSATGVDLSLTVAGPGARSYAFVVDWHIRLLLAMAWFVVMSFVVSGSLSFVSPNESDFTTYALLVIAPTAALYLLYHPILEILMRGKTPGKRMAGVRVVTQEGQVPGAGAQIIRNLLRIVDSLPTGYIVGLSCTLLTKHSVRIGDLAAGTVLVYDTDARQASAATLTLDQGAVARHGIETTELIQELLQRWPQLTSAARIQLGARLLQQLDPSATPEQSDHSIKRRLEALLQEPNLHD